MAVTFEHRKRHVRHDFDCVVPAQKIVSQLRQHQAKLKREGNSVAQATKRTPRSV